METDKEQATKHCDENSSSVIRDDAKTSRGSSGGLWICRLCGKEDKDISVALDKVPNFTFLRSHCTKNSKEVRLAQRMQTHAATEQHMPMWNFACTKNFLEKRSDTGASNVDLAVEYALVKSSAKFTYEEFTELVPTPIAVHKLSAYVGLRIGSCRAILKGILLDKIDREIRKIEKWKLMTKAHHELLWPALRRHFLAMQSAISANSEIISSTTMDHATVYQLIQDVFVGNHYGASIVYKPPLKRQLDCDPLKSVSSPLRVIVHGNPLF